jgi:hypothetical protein
MSSSITAFSTPQMSSDLEFDQSELDAKVARVEAAAQMAKESAADSEAYRAALETEYAPQDLTCPISLNRMRQVATTLCGHSFELSEIKKIDRDDWGYFNCPGCRQQTTIAPSAETIKKMIAAVSRRNKLQAACDNPGVHSEEKYESSPIENNPNIVPEIRNTIILPNNRPGMELLKKNFLPSLALGVLIGSYVIGRSLQFPSG